MLGNHVRSERAADQLAWRQVLALPLFMAGIRANDVDHPFAAYDLAILADSFNAGANLHAPSYPENVELYQIAKYSR